MKFIGVSFLCKIRQVRYQEMLLLCINLPLQNGIRSSKKCQLVSVKGIQATDSATANKIDISCRYNTSKSTAFRCVVSTPAIRNTIF